ncbi:uncharacterized protein LOC119434043 [Dermacentor silvarum]|uniref:uncharacterized protein LOC119434043 n=1 Tax=Dermacentor silvarum TaxID=543639 RepID=UPI00189C4395|nr:uncharacterized protein LOC119434043 [Dermacentor silvarum]
MVNCFSDLGRGGDHCGRDVPVRQPARSLTAARQAKKEKYQPVREYLLRKFQKVSVATIVVGVIGSWEPRNDRVMHRFCSRKYLRLLKNLAASETIAAYRVLATSTQCTSPPSE